MNFAEQYGPWAVIAGASEGTGRAFARQIAAKGVPCVLIARRQGPLDAVAKEIQVESGVKCVTASVDLALPDACARIVAAVGGREVGLVVLNAGADPNGSRFLDKDIGTWLELMRRNVPTTMECCHHFGRLMRARGKGGLLIVNSGAAYGAGPFLATYSASKAFELNFGEGLWAELRSHGVHVLNLMMSMTDTPAFRALLTEKGLPFPPGVASADAVAELGLKELPNGPTCDWGQSQNPPASGPTLASQRRERVLSIEQSSKKVFGDS